ncbi:alpha/beta hydrolase [Sphingomonadaceae bacterium G21617-S1]|nr:alpha/beta hydrolase [Sphingomonadaceae bacterium G21617-S1]
MAGQFETITTRVLEIGYEEHGQGSGGRDVVLLHGFPYDVRCYDHVAPKLADAGCRVFVPYLRGCGPTRFLSESTFRSGEQAALASDLFDFVDALGLDRPLLAGFDWGGRAATATAALWPERFSGLLTTGGYSIYNVAEARHPAPPQVEWVLWYQYYFLTDRGRAGLQVARRDLCRLLWRLWSPTWPFDDATFDMTAASFENPDFVDIVLHSYRHRLGGETGDPVYAEIEARLSRRPAVIIPAAVLSSGHGPLPASPPDVQHMRNMLWTDIVEHGGHNLPQQCPSEFAKAVLRLVHDTDGG